MKTWPAIDVRGAADPDLVLALVDGFAPTAAEERGDTIRVFFADAGHRDQALDDLRDGPLAGALHLNPVDVPDDDWARRSQQNLPPITIGRITIVPSAPPVASSDRAAGAIQLIIQPSTGFGTGHHATTRLCLEALQGMDLGGSFVLDVGTGSGILAIAAVRLGAARALGLDCDPDAIRSAEENAALNGDTGAVAFALGDLTAVELPRADVVTANLTGALLQRTASALMRAAAPRGRLVLSGMLLEEVPDVRAAFGRRVLWEGEEDEWGAIVLGI